MRKTSLVLPSSKRLALPSSSQTNQSDIIVVDPSELQSKIREVEREVEYELDDDEIFQFLFTHLTHKSKVEEEIAYSFLAIAAKPEIGLLMTYTDRVNEMFALIQMLSRKLVHDLSSYGCYHRDKLVYLPMTEMHTLQPGRIKLEPLVLVRMDPTHDRSQSF